MIEHAAEMLRRLGSPGIAIEMRNGGISPPPFTFSTDMPFYGFPPVLVPVWANEFWPGYLAYRPGFFSTMCSQSFVYYFAESQNMKEVARDESQLRVWLAYYAYCEVPELDEQDSFVQQLGFEGARQVEEVFEDVDGPSDLLGMPEFAANPPAGLVSWDVAESWVTTADEESLQTAFASNLPGLAWRILNSPGWNGLDVARSLEALRGFDPSAEFGALADFWISEGSLPK